MQVNITFRGIESTESLKNHVKDRVEHIEKYFDRAVETHAVLSLERYLHNADITIHAGPYVLRGRVKSEDMYKSIDEAIDKIEKQLKRYKGRIRANQHRAVPEADAAFKVRSDVLEMPAEEPEEAGEEWTEGPKIVTSDEVMAKTMSVDEAVMQMELADQDFFVFTNAKSGLVNVLYHRKDGHLGLLEVAPSPAAADPAKKAQDLRA
ncbi:MAG: ribosome hibernation-promoting factor, HPF/YfiA family [Myxococcales bacterium]|jgi:putative sigma-54 modulation protein